MITTTTTTTKVTTTKTMMMVVLMMTQWTASLSLTMIMKKEERRKLMTKAVAIWVVFIKWTTTAAFTRWWLPESSSCTSTRAVVPLICTAASNPIFDPCKYTNFKILFLYLKIFWLKNMLLFLLWLLLQLQLLKAVVNVVFVVPEFYCYRRLIKPFGGNCWLAVCISSNSTSSGKWSEGMCGCGQPTTLFSRSHSFDMGPNRPNGTMPVFV